MTNQEIFDRVATHLLLQGKPAMAPNLYRPTTGKPICAYRGDGGTSCAIGCLITDEAYDPMLEGRSAQTALVREALEKSGVDRGSKNRAALLRRLQGVHDDSRDCGPEYLVHIQRRLREVATTFGLKA